MANKKSTTLLNDKDKALSAYRTMLLIRRFEERAGQLYGMGLIGGFCHLYIGQEAVAAGISASKQDGDSVITSYRDHGHLLACGSDPKTIMAELTGREDGCSKGKGGSMHVFDKERNFYGGHGIVGAQVPLGTGIAFAHKYKKDNGVCYTFYGEGAANQGQVYESFNMAALWNLPIVFVLENNRYAMGTSIERSSVKKSEYYRRGEALGVKGTTINGQNVDEVYKICSEITKEVRSGKGPRILEVQTYRYRGHSMSDPAKYRAKSEVDEYRKFHDPINSWKKILLDNKFKEQDILDIDEEVKKTVLEAVEFAKASPEPSSDELMTDVLIS